jgi:quercetin dioxygenase-like cupin family protein
MIDTQMTRRDLLGCTAAAMALGAWPAKAGPAAGGDGAQEQPAIVLGADEGELLISGRRRAPMRLKIDSARSRGVSMSMVVSEVPPGTAIPVHRHHNEDELIFIHAGEGVLTVGARTRRVSAGAMLYGPRGVWHGIENRGSGTLVWCAIYVPAGFEQFFREVGVPPGRERELPPPDRVNAIAARYGLEFRDA